MSGDLLDGLVWLGALLAIVAAWRQLGTRRSHIGPGAGGAVYDMLNEDKRRAIEIIVEQRTAETDPERADGNVPDAPPAGEAPTRREQEIREPPPSADARRTPRTG